MEMGFDKWDVPSSLWAQCLNSKLKKHQLEVRLSHVSSEPIRYEDLTQVNPNPLGEEYLNMIG